MITVGSITDWVDLPVLDRDGSKIGSLSTTSLSTQCYQAVLVRLLQRALPPLIGKAAR
jgi:hypothetical protein